MRDRDRREWTAGEVGGQVRALEAEGIEVVDGQQAMLDGYAAP